MPLGRGKSSVSSDITIDADLDFLNTYQVKNLAAPAAKEALRKGQAEIINADIKSDAAIAYSKLNLALKIRNADVKADAAIVLSKIAAKTLPNATTPTNSKGNSFATVQAAIDDLAGDGWVYVPAGTYSEALTITDADVELFGAGRNVSIIDGGTTSHAINITGANCLLRDLQAKTTQGGGESYIPILCYGDGAILINCLVSASDTNGITITQRSIVMGCIIQNCDAYGIEIAGAGDNSIITGNFIDTTGNDGIYIQADAEDCVIDGNRITAWTGEAIDDDSGTSTVGDNDTT